MENAYRKVLAMTVLGLLVLAQVSTLSMMTTEDPLKIAVYDTNSAGVSLIYAALLAEGYDTTMIDASDIITGEILNYDVAIFGGGSTHIFDWLNSSTYRQNIQSYITNGGKYIGICGGGFLGIWIVDGFKLLQALAYLKNYAYLLAYDLLDTKGKWLIKWKRGNSFDESGYQYICWAGGTEYSTLLDNGFQVEAKYIGVKIGLWYCQKPAIVSGTYGQGKIILFGPHPEYPCPYPDGSDNMHLVFKAVEL